MIPIPDPATILAAASFAKDLYGLLEPQLSKIVEAKSDRYLNYDPSFLLRAYAGEHPVAHGITYTEVCELSDLVPLSEPWNDDVVRLTVQKTDFRRAAGTSLWQKASATAFAARVAEGRTRLNEPSVRVTEMRRRDGVVSVRLQRAHYHDQAFTNLVLDFDRTNPSLQVSLRSQLESKYGNHLPALNDPRLASTLGVAALLFYWGRDRTWVPYIVRRVKKIGVFPGGLHCTASGVAKWPRKSNVATLENFATRHMLDEIAEEVGLFAADLLDFRPVALCREMARAGKPQIFYAGLTLLDRQTLRARRIRARRVIKETTQIQELERDRWMRSADVVLTPSSLRARTSRWGLTLEAAASLHYGVRYLSGISAYLGRLRTRAQESS